MLKKHFKMLCTMALLSLFLQQSAIASTMYPNAFDNIFEKYINDFTFASLWHCFGKNASAFRCAGVQYGRCV